MRRFPKIPLRAIPLLLLMGLAACSIQDRSLTTVTALSPTARECGKCHVAIYREWGASKHARAYVNPAFRELTLGYRTASCLPCHIPQSAVDGPPPVRTRDYLLAEGVTCVGCHLIAGEHHGPFFAGAITPHATRRDRGLYESAELCGGCHEGTYKTWRAARAAAPKTKTCQECHMATVLRKMTQATGPFSKAIVALHDSHDLRRHTFDAAKLPDEPAVEIALLERVELEGVVEYRLEARNLLPHGIPTGDYGHRQAALEAAFVDAQGNERARVVRDYYRDLKTQLPPDGRTTVTLKVDAAIANSAGGRLRVTLSRVDRAGKVVYRIADKIIPLTDKPEGKP